MRHMEKIYAIANYNSKGMKKRNGLRRSIKKMVTRKLKKEEASNA